jgi:hypothetical protein
MIKRILKKYGYPPEKQNQDVKTILEQVKMKADEFSSNQEIMDYKMENINIGDEVYFDAQPSQGNHDLYWKVIHKDEKEKRLVVQLHEMGYKDLR